MKDRERDKEINKARSQRPRVSRRHEPHHEMPVLFVAKLAQELGGKDPNERVSISKSTDNTKEVGDGRPTNLASAPKND